MPIRLHVNVDHVATVRNARGTRYPDPLFAAHVCETSGADGITAHLREDRRHITDEDVAKLRSSVTSHFNLECAATEEMLQIVRNVVPDTITLVPERRQERTTEGGLDVAGQRSMIERFVQAANEIGSRVSLFVAPDEATIELSKQLGAMQIELHTGEYCHACEPGRGSDRDRELERLHRAADLASSMRLEVAAGHGLTRHNVGPVVAIGAVVEVNIGHSIVADAIFLGLSRAVAEMRESIDRHIRG